MSHFRLCIRDNAMMLPSSFEWGGSGVVLNVDAALVRVLPQFLADGFARRQFPAGLGAGKRRAHRLLHRHRPLERIAIRREVHGPWYRLALERAVRKLHVAGDVVVIVSV